MSNQRLEPTRAGASSKKRAADASRPPFLVCRDSGSAVRLSRGSRSIPVAGRGITVPVRLTLLRVAPPLVGRLPAPEGCGRIGLAARAEVSIGAGSGPGCRRRPVSSPWWAAAASSAARRALQRPARDRPAASSATSHHGRCGIAGPADSLVPVEPPRGGRRERCRAALTQARPGASPEVPVPLQRSLAAPRCPVLPASGRSRCGVQTRLAIGPAGATASASSAKRSSVRGRWRNGSRALAVFRLRPP